MAPDAGPVVRAAEIPVALVVALAEGMMDRLARLLVGFRDAGMLVTVYDEESRHIMYRWLHAAVSEEPETRQVSSVVAHALVQEAFSRPHSLLAVPLEAQSLLLPAQSRGL